MFFQKACFWLLQKLPGPPKFLPQAFPLEALGMPRMPRTPPTPRTTRAKNTSPKGQAPKGGAAVVPSWGSSIRRPPKVDTACWTTYYLFEICPTSSIQEGSSDMFSIPLSIISPQEGGDHRRPEPSLRFLCLFGLLGRFLALLKRASNFASKKHRKKCENWWFWPPKTLPKPSQNPFKIEVPRKMPFFHRFVFDFFIFSIFDFFKICILPR